MYTCRTCKLLCRSQAIREIIYEDDGSIRTFKARANNPIEIMADWHCPYYFWSQKPDNGCGCKHWKNKHGKNWL